MKVNEAQVHNLNKLGVLIRPDFRSEHAIEGTDKTRYSFDNVTFRNAKGQQLELGEYHVAATSMRVALFALETMARHAQKMTPEQFETFKRRNLSRVLRFNTKINDRRMKPKFWKKYREAHVSMLRRHDTEAGFTNIFGGKPMGKLKYNDDYIRRIEYLADLLRPKVKETPKPGVHPLLRLEEMDHVSVNSSEPGVEIKYHTGDNQESAWSFGNPQYDLNTEQFSPGETRSIAG